MSFESSDRDLVESILRVNEEHKTAEKVWEPANGGKFAICDPCNVVLGEIADDIDAELLHHEHVISAVIETLGHPRISSLHLAGSAGTKFDSKGPTTH